MIGPGREAVKTCNVLLGWLHCDTKAGFGRTVTGCDWEMICSAKRIFFPSGTRAVGETKFGLPDCNVKNISGEHAIKFTLEEYIESEKLPGQGWI